METKQLKYYKVFLASSNELSKEREDFFQYTIKINKVLVKFGFQIDVEAWEFADPELPNERSQDEYNKILKDCDECIVLFWRKAGKYSKEELEIAYNERFGNGKISRLVVYFKDVKDGDIPKNKKGEKEFEKLKKLKNGFAKKHGEKFFAQCPNIESVENDFLLFFIDKNVPNAKLTIQDSNIVLDGEKMGNISNLSFAYYNKPYQRLSKEVSDLERDLSSLKNTNPSSSSIPLFEKELFEKKKKLEELEKSLMDMAQTITRITTSDPDNKKVVLAQKQFNEGNYYEALATLGREEILADLAWCDKDYESAKEWTDKAKDKYRAAIETIVLRIQYLSVAKPKGWFIECKELYEQVVLHAKKCYADGELASLLFDQAYFFQENNQFADAISVFEEVLVIYRQLAETSPEVYLLNVAWTLNNLSILYSNVCKHSDAEMEFKESMEIYRQLAESSPETYLPDVAMTLNSLGILHVVTGKHSEAETEFKVSMEIYRQLAETSPEAYLPYLAKTLFNIALYRMKQGNLSEAEQMAQESLEKYQSIAELSPAFNKDVKQAIILIRKIFVEQAEKNMPCN